MTETQQQETRDICLELRHAVCGVLSVLPVQVKRDELDVTIKYFVDRAQAITLKID